MKADVEMVKVQLSRWDVEFQHRLSALCDRTGSLPFTAVVRVNEQCPSGHVLLYFDPFVPAQLVLLHQLADGEQVYETIGKEPFFARLVGVEPINSPVAHV